MASLTYEKIYSYFFTKVEAYDFLELSDAQVDTFLVNYLHLAANKPYIRRLFSSLNLDDEIHEISFEMKYTVDEFSDTDFIIDVLSIGLAIEWLEPKINSITNIAQMFGSKEEKFYSQSNHLSELRALKDSFVKQQRRTIADRGYAWNTYLDGE